jgi:hypothetical protein
MRLAAEGKAAWNVRPVATIPYSEGRFGTAGASDALVEEM